MSGIERREIIDSVAGLSEFDQKKQEAIKELNKVDTRIKEAMIILNERNTFLEEMEKEMNAAKEFEGQVEIVDLRTLNPLDEEAIFESVRKTNRCLVVTEDAVQNSFARNLSGLIQEKCFTALEAPVMTIGSESMPAIPLNSVLEETMIPSAEKVAKKIKAVLEF
jgi:pyruvate/2-oxoglutarate/acetoin dehydrogenase E1 component